MSKVAVSEDAKTKSYYKYYEWDVEDPTEEEFAMIAQSKGSPEDALAAKDRAKMQDAGSYPEKTGYYPLKEGGVLVAGNVEMPDVTAEMLNWWFAWHGLDPLRYTIWDPDDHYGVTIDEIGRERALDPKVPMAEKNWGATHVVVEAMGGPADEVLIAFKNPGEMGFDLKKIGTDTCEFMVTANCKLGDVIPSMMIEVAKKLDGVMTYQARFWVGYNVVDGEAKCLLPEGVTIPDEVAQGVIGHCIKEFRHLNKILPKVYAEEKDRW